MFFSLPRSSLVPLIVSCALFMQIFDGSVIATSLPVIARSLQTDPLHLSLAITSYLFSLAVFTPLSGWVADRYGARTAFRAAILVFTLSSVLCAGAQNLTQLILARLLQGVGGAVMLPVGRLLLLKSVPKNGLVDAMAWLMVPAMIAPVLGPPVGGFIVTYSSWRWIFLINLPIGLLGIVMASLYIENIREDRVDPLDIRGFLLMAGALAGLVISFETVGRHVLPLSVVLGSCLAGFFFLALYAWHARHTKNLIVDFGLFRLPAFRAAMGGGSLFRIGIGAMPFLLPLMMQVGFGLSALSSGLLTFASAIGALLVKTIAARILRSFGFRRVLIFNALIGSIFMILYGFFSPNTPHKVILAVLLMGGFFHSLQFTALNTFVFSDVPSARMSRATTLFSMLQQLFLSVGVASGALALNLTLVVRHSDHLTSNDFAPGFWCVGLISFLSVFFFLPLPSHAGAEMSGHKPLKQEIPDDL